MQQNHSTGRQPIDKGRVCVVVEKYPSSQVDPQTRQPIMKNRYANVGRATLWPSNQGSMMPNVQMEIDTMPIGVSGPVSLHIFWDSESQRNQQQPQQQAPQQAPYQQQPQQR